MNDITIVISGMLVGVILAVFMFPNTCYDEKITLYELGEIVRIILNNENATILKYHVVDCELKYQVRLQNNEIDEFYSMELSKK